MKFGHLLALACLTFGLLWCGAASADIIIPPEDPPSPQPPAEPPPEAGCQARADQGANLLVIAAIAAFAVGTLRSSRAALEGCTPAQKGR